MTIDTATLCRHCKSTLNPGADVCAACGHTHLTRRSVGAGVAAVLMFFVLLFGGVVGFAWLMGGPVPW